MIKKILITLLVVVVVLAGIGFLLPAKVRVERKMVMNAPVENVFSQVNVLKNWPAWSPWAKKDPNMKVEYFGPESGVGGGYKWESKNDNVGTGSLKIAEMVPNEKIVTELNFMEQGSSFGGFLFAAKENNSTEITWYMDMDMGMNPVARYFGLMMDKMLGADFEEGLKYMKEVSEKMPVKPALKIEATTSSDMVALTVKSSCTPDKMSEALGNCYAEIVGFMTKNKLKQTSPVFAIYTKYGADGVEFEAGIPVDKIPAKLEGNVTKLEMKAGNIIMAHHYGSYESTEASHAAVDEWAKANGKTITGNPWEVYVTDPSTEPDMNKWYTQICYPIQ